MRDLDKALSDITAMRSQMARAAEFRGYGPLTVGATGLLAVIAGTLQVQWVPDPASEILGYLALWIATATISVILIGIEMVARTRRIHSGIADEMIHAATEQFIPAGVAGALLTFVLYQYAPQSLWMLPGLWQIIFSLGFLASCGPLSAAVTLPYGPHPCRETETLPRAPKRRGAGQSRRSRAR